MAGRNRKRAWFQFKFGCRLSFDNAEILYAFPALPRRVSKSKWFEGAGFLKTASSSEIYDALTHQWELDQPRPN